MLLCSVFAKGQVKFTSGLTHAIISRDEYATIRFVLENAADVQNIIPPSFNDFLLISGPVQETGMTNINGTVLNYLAISFVFKTKGPGKFIIPGAIAKVGGKNYKSNPVTLVVKKSRSSNLNNNNLPFSIQNIFSEPKPANTFDDYILKKGEDVNDKVNKNMQLRLEVNKTSCYVGEPVIASYKLYTRLKSESKLIQNPSFSGFSVVDLQASDVTASAVEKLNGRNYNVYTIRKAQLYPLQEGKIELESAEIENKIQFIRESYAKNNANAFSDIFDDFANAMVPPEGMIDQTVVLKSKPVNIEVKALPTAGKPSIFKGAVGEFAIEAGLEKNSIHSGSAGKLIVLISGSGNMQLLNPPEITWPENTEAFDIKISDIMSMTSVPVSGKKVFEYPFSVDKPGIYIIPSIHFSYFDPFKKKYKIINTPAISFTVTKKAAVALMHHVIVPLENNSLYNKIFLERKWLVLIIGVFIFCGLVVYLKKDNLRNKKEKADQISILQKASPKDIILVASANSQQNPLAETEICLNDPECVAFYACLLREMKGFLSDKFAIAPLEINSKKLMDKMDKKNISNETILSLQQLLQDIEWQVYTPFERNEKMKELYRRSQELLQLINTYNAKVL